MAPDEPADRSSAAVEHLATGLEAMKANLSSMVVEARELRNDVRIAEQGRKRATGVALALMLLLVFLVVSAVIITAQNNETVHKVDGVARSVSDCTTPGGKCYQQGGARTGQAIADVIRAQLYLSECARLYPGEVGPEYDRKLEKCVYGRLAKDPPPAAHLSPAPSPSPGEVR